MTNLILNLRADILSLASYLKDLRTNRPARPSGSRPIPTRPAMSTPDLAEDLPPRASSVMSTYKDMGRESAENIVEEHPPRAASALSSHRTPSSRFSFGSSAGRPLAQGPREVFVRKNVSPSQYHKTRKMSPGTAYLENAQRRREKEEARSLRDALEADDELRIHQSAQDEATELVWMHQNPDAPAPNPYAPYRNPDMDGSPKAGRSQRQSLGNRRSLISGSPRHRASHHPPGGDHGLGIGNDDADLTSKTRETHFELGQERNETARKGRRVDFALPPEDNPELISRKVSGDSSIGIFRNPNDQIYEEPKDTRDQADTEKPIASQADISALKAKPRNSLLRGSRPFPGRFSSPDFANKLARFDNHKKPPSQSRDPQYKINEPISDLSDVKQEQEPSPTKNGKEIRGDDIRAATSKKLSDRSEKLPMPSAVSDRVGRPIVSFDTSWKASEVQPERGRDSPSKCETASPTPSQPAPPTIEVTDTPTIPVINVPDEEPTISQMEPTTKPGNKAQHAGSSKRPTAALQDRWRSSYSRSGVPTARCESCTLPIAGRIVTAAGSRFHPECFICSHCQTPLECVAFYQEPAAKRNERLANTGGDDEEAQALRFYCALDFHEMFSPRCKSCKTPIEGEVVVACGAEWHVGHFFCAECGDV